MTRRVLLVTSKSADGYNTATAMYCGNGCGQAVTRQVQHELGHAVWHSSVTGVTVYERPDGSTEHHEWVDRRAVVCCGAACVQAGTRTAGAA